MRASESAGEDLRFEQLANDRSIVANLHLVCDGWCEQCPYTKRCLFFRCLEAYRAHRGQGVLAPTKVCEVLTFRRRMVQLDPQLPTRVDKLWNMAVDLTADETVAAAALDYSRRSARFIATAALSSSRRVRARATSPPPPAIVLRFHSRIYFKVSRALVARAAAEAGNRSFAAEAAASAAQVLSCAARSRDALAQYAPSVERRSLIELLDEITREMEHRFPSVRAWRDDCLRRASSKKTTPAAPTTKFDIGNAELARRP